MTNSIEKQARFLQVCTSPYHILSVI